MKKETITQVLKMILKSFKKFFNPIWGGVAYMQHRPRYCQ